MKILDPNLPDGVHAWRDGRRFVKEGVKVYLEGTDTLAGRYFRPFFYLYHNLRTIFTPPALLPWTRVCATSHASQAVHWVKQSNVRRSTPPGKYFA